MPFTASHCHSPRAMTVVRFLQPFALICALTFAQHIYAQNSISYPLAKDAAEENEFTPPGRFQIRKYGTADGLLNTTIKDIEQDAKGYLWLATDEGMYRFDGFDFDYFGREQGLPSTNIELSFLDQNQTFWVSTSEGLSYWNDQGFQQLGTESGLDQSKVADLADGPNGLWLATAAGPYVVNREMRAHKIAAWPGSAISALSAAENGSAVWLASWNGNTQIYCWRENQFSLIKIAAEFADQRVYRMLADKNGRIWARTLSGLWVKEADSNQFLSVETPFNIASPRAEMSSGRHGDIYVLSDQGLLHHRNNDWGIITPQQGLPQASLRSAFEDREGSLWIGSSGMGLFRILGKDAIRIYSNEAGLPNNSFRAIYRAANHRLWVGTQSGLAVWKDHKWQVVPGTEHIAARTIIETSQGVLLFAGVPANEIFSYDPANSRLQSHKLSDQNSAIRINRIALDGEGRLWVATYGGGLFMDAGKPPSFRFEREQNIADTEIVGDLHLDVKGRFWIGHQSGLSVLENDSWRKFTAADGLEHNYVPYVRSSRNGDLLIAYQEPRGAKRIRVEQGKLNVIKQFNTENALATNKVYLLGEDSSQNLWVGASNGVNIISDQHSEHLSARDGLANDDLNNMAFLSEPDGTVWLGSIDGLTRIQTKNYKEKPNVGKPIFAHLTLGDMKIQGSQTQTMASKEHNTLAADLATLNFLDEGDIEFQVQLVGLEKKPRITKLHELRYPELHHGDYRLEVSARASKHSAWSPKAEFDFEILPAWWQSLRMQAIYAAAFVGLLLMLFNWRTRVLQLQHDELETQVGLRTSELNISNQLQARANEALEHRNIDLEALNQKLIEAQNQLLQSEKLASVGQLAAGMAHEINTPIGYVNSNIESLKEYVEDLFALLGAYESLDRRHASNDAEIADLQAIRESIDLDFIRKDAFELFAETSEGVKKVSNIVKDLREFSHLDDAQWQYVDLHQGIDSTINLVRNEIEAKAELIKAYGKLPEVRCLPFQINQVMMNLLINAAQAIEEFGKITVRTDCNEKQIWIFVTDTGKGISQDNIGRIFDPFFTTKPVGKGLGLSLAYSTIKNHGGLINVSSEVGKGTTFAISLPIHGPASPKL